MPNWVLFTQEFNPGLHHFSCCIYLTILIFVGLLRYLTVYCHSALVLTNRKNNREKSRSLTGCRTVPSRFWFDTPSNKISTSFCNSLDSTKYLACSAKGSTVPSILVMGALTPANMTVTYWKSGRRKALTVHPSLTCSITATKQTNDHIIKHYRVIKSDMKRHPRPSMRNQ